MLVILLLAACGGAAGPPPLAMTPTPVSPSAATATALPPVSPTANLTASCVETFDPLVDYFPDQVTVAYGAGFSVEYARHYKLVTVETPFPGAEVPATFLLVQCGAPVPDGFDDAIIVEVPVQRMVALSTSYLPYLPALGLVDRLVGVENFSFITTEAIREQIDAGALAEVGSGGEVNVEAVLAAAPDLVMTFATGAADFDAGPKLEEAGVTVVLNADYLEVSPLGRTEWVKFIATFFNAEAAATTWFDGVAAEYEALVDLAAAVDERPTVLLNTPFDNIWYLPGGEGYQAQLLRDAGASYVWADEPGTASLALDFEAVYARAADAEYWINVGFYGGRDDLLATDERFGEFDAFATGQIFNNDARQNAFGGWDYYEGGVANPNLVLADLIKLFHPELLPDHAFVYYRPLE
jgi:iron complex transport system substrate-binding protein